MCLLTGNVSHVSEVAHGSLVIDKGILKHGNTLHY